jgi:hypothetical protein
MNRLSANLRIVVPANGSASGPTNSGWKTELDDLMGSTAGRQTIADNDVGLPYEAIG